MSSSGICLITVNNILTICTVYLVYRCSALNLNQGHYITIN